MKKGILFISLLTLALLQACGGDGGDSGSTSPTSGGGGGGSVTPPSGGDGGGTVTPPSGGDGGGTVTPPSGGDGGGSGGTTPPAAGDQGSVSAPFVVTAQSRYLMFSPSATSMGPLVDAQQSASGAMVGLTSSSNTMSLGGTSATKDIAGDASYAIGRWVQGTATTYSGTEELTGADNRSYYYAVDNIPASFPAVGSYACGLQSATTPTRVSGTGPDTGVMDSTGVALSFDTAGAHLSGTTTVTVGGETATAGVPTLLTNPSSWVAAGQYYANGTGNLVQVADAGNGNYGLMVGYAALMSSGALYHGVAYLSCAAN